MMSNYNPPTVKILYFTEKEIIVAYYEAPGRRFDKERQRLKVKIFSREELI